MKHPTKQHLIGWLEANESRDVGQKGEPESCPLANFVGSEFREVVWVAVDGEYIEYEHQHGHIGRITLRKWAKQFVSSIDELPARIVEYAEEEYYDYDPAVGDDVWMVEEYPIYDFTVYGYDALKVLGG